MKNICIKSAMERRSKNGWIRAATALILATFLSIWIVEDSAARRALLLDNPDMVPRLYTAYGATMRAEQLFAQGNGKAAGIAARQALLTNHGDVVAVRTLALVAEKQGRLQQAAQLMAIGARWSWRDTPTQTWLFVHLAQNGAYPEAILHGEALAARDAMPDFVFPALAALAAEPPAIQPLLSALERGTSWRSGFYQYLRKAPPELHPALGQLMLAKLKSTAPPTRSDASPLLEAMIDAGEAVEARRLWGRLFWRPAQPMPAILDGGFENAASAIMATNSRSVFEWQFDPTAELYIVADPARGGSHVLHIVGAGSGHGALVRQRLVLEPGSWLLDLRLRSDLPELSSRLRIGIRCDDGGAWLTEALHEPARTDNWQAIVMPLSVSNACGSQSLTIEPNGTAPGDALEVWIDDLAVRRDPRGKVG